MLLCFYCSLAEDKTEGIKQQEQTLRQVRCEQSIRLTQTLLRAGTAAVLMFNCCLLLVVCMLCCVCTWQELAAAHAHHAIKRSCMEEQQRQQFSMTSEVQHQELAVAECQVRINCKHHCQAVPCLQVLLAAAPVH
jgi:hypothetical protein